MVLSGQMPTRTVNPPPTGLPSRASDTAEYVPEKRYETGAAPDDSTETRFPAPSYRVTSPPDPRSNEIERSPAEPSTAPARLSATAHAAWPDASTAAPSILWLKVTLGSSPDTVPPAVFVPEQPQRSVDS